MGAPGRNVKVSAPLQGGPPELPSGKAAAARAASASSHHSCPGATVGLSTCRGGKQDSHKLLRGHDLRSVKSATIRLKPVGMRLACSRKTLNLGSMPGHILVALQATGFWGLCTATKAPHIRTSMPTACTPDGRLAPADARRKPSGCSASGSSIRSTSCCAASSPAAFQGLPQPSGSDLGFVSKPRGRLQAAPPARRILGCRTRGLAR